MNFMSKKAKILIAAGGSAGHLYPALALAAALRDKDPQTEIGFISSRRGIERQVEEEGYRLFLISIVSLRRNFVNILPGLYRFFKSFIESFLIIESFRPDCIVGFGSYVSLPVLLEGAFFKKPTVIHEQNVSLGLANRVLSLLADRIALSFRPMNSGKVKDRKRIYTGYPLRKWLRRVDRREAGHFFALTDKFTIMVLGGSQGSHKINFEFRQAVDMLIKSGEDFQFIHITGKNDYISLKEEYKCVTINKSIFEFLTQMHLAYSLADLVIARAGAGTIAELAYFALPAILIPYPYAGGHQLENGLALRSRRAAVVIEDKELCCELLYDNIIGLMHSQNLRAELKRNIGRFADEDASGNLADVVLSLL